MVGPESVKSTDHPREYLPSREQEERLSLLGSIVSALDAAGVRYAVAGGYGIDGLYGALTRDHDDIDLLIDDAPGHIDRTRQSLENIGCVRLRTKKSGVEVFTHVPTGTIIEIPTWAITAERTRAHDALFLPDFHNARLGTLTFPTMTLGGHEIYDETQSQRALEGGWGRYPKREHKNWLIRELAKWEEQGIYPVAKR